MEDFTGRLASGAGGELAGTFLASRVTFLAQIVLVHVSLGTSFASVRSFTSQTVVKIAFLACDLGT